MGNGDRCFNCGKLIRYKTNARPRKYCDDACRQSAYRLRAKLKQTTLDADVYIRAYQTAWGKAGFPDDLIAHLTEFWRKHGTDALTRVMTILSIHGTWTTERTARLLTERLAEDFNV